MFLNDVPIIAKQFRIIDEKLRFSLTADNANELCYRNIVGSRWKVLISFVICEKKYGTYILHIKLINRVYEKINRKFYY